MPKLKPVLNKEASCLGLDVGTYAVKLARINFAKDKVVLSHFLAEHYEQPADLEQVLKKIAQTPEFKKVNIAVSGPSTIIRYADFPKMKDDEFKKALKFEAQKHIPFPLAEVNLDGSVLKEDLPDNKMLVLLAAAKKDSLMPRLKLYENFGLKINIIDIDSIALINAFNYNYSQEPLVKNKTVALLNMGNSLSNLNILEDGLPRLSRDIHIAGSSITQKISDSLRVDLKVADNLKISPDAQKQEKVVLAAESILSNLAREVRISFDFYESQSASSVERIFLSGGGALFSTTIGVFKNLLGIDVEYWDPLKHIQVSGGVDPQTIKASSSLLAVAVGLALRR